MGFFYRKFKEQLLLSLVHIERPLRSNSFLLHKIIPYLHFSSNILFQAAIFSTLSPLFLPILVTEGCFRGGPVIYVLAFDLLGVTQCLFSSCRPEEQGEDYREQLLSTAVKPRQSFPHLLLSFCSPLPSLLTNPWCILDDYRTAPGTVRLSFRSVFLLLIVAGDALVPSLSNLVHLPWFGFLVFVSFGCQNYFLLSKVAICL